MKVTIDAIEFIKDVTTNCDAVQERVLAEILSRNAETEYLKRHRMEGRTDLQSFKSRIPVISYEDIRPEIRRIADGDFSPILSADPVTELLTSSGTSGGEAKLIPTIKDDLERRRLFNGLIATVMNLYVPEGNKGKVLSFRFIRDGTKTPGGLLALPSLTRYYKSDQFRNRVSGPRSQFTSPIESILCLETFQSMYTQMLAGLYERLEVFRVGTVYASVLSRVINFLQLHYSELCQDIAMGTLSPKIIDPSLIRAMSRIMRPDPDLARIIEECSKENWEGIIKRVWPNTRNLEVIITGAMAQYIPTIDYYSGGLPKVSMAYRSSEGSFGINLEPMAEPPDVSYTIMPNMAYFEFIPLGSSDSFNTASLVDLAKVEVGKEYELVVTNYAGLYRYRVGDVLLVTGFHNAAPQFRFVRRKNVLLSIDNDMTDEADLQQAINNASKFLHQYSNATIFEYTTYADTNTFPGHYVVYLELMQPNEPVHQPDNKLFAKCCLEMEESLNAIYRECRVDGSLGPLEIRVVAPGTFEALMDYVVSKGASIEQYKTPRCVDSLLVVRLLDSRVVSAHFSPSTPRWSPTACGGCAVAGNK